jgi:hypothetical protein
MIKQQTDPKFPPSPSSQAGSLTVAESPREPCFDRPHRAAGPILLAAGLQQAKTLTKTAP